MKFRYIFLGLGSVLTLFLMFLTDPDAKLITGLPVGAGTVTLLLILLSSIFYIGMLYLGRKALFDYIELGDLIKKASQSSEGAGAALIGIGLFSISIAIVILAATN